MQALVLTFVIPAISLIFAALFAAMWWQDRARRHVLAYAVSYAALATGVAVNIWIFGAVGPFGIVLYHLLSMGGLIALMWGVSRRVGQKIPMFAYLATVLLTSLVLSYAISHGESDAMRLAQNINSALLIALTAQNLWNAGPRSLADRALIWVLVLFAGFGFTRPLLTVFSDAIFGPGEAGAAILFAVHVLALAVLLTLQALALIATIIVDRMEEQRGQATIDLLSGLNMRAAFEADARIMLADAANKAVPVSLIVADIDHFKRINDGWGHAIGDIVISKVGTLIANTIRDQDVAGRIGGEEFCVLVWNCDGAAAAQLAERLRKAAAALNDADASSNLNITISLGVAQAQENENYPALFERADGYLYEAKNGGRNRVVADGEEIRRKERRMQPAEVVSIHG